MIKLTGKQEPDAAQIAKNLPSAREQMGDQRREEVFAVYVTNITQQYEKSGRVFMNKKAQQQPIIPGKYSGLIVLQCSRSLSHPSEAKWRGLLMVFEWYQMDAPPLALRCGAFSVGQYPSTSPQRRTVPQTIIGEMHHRIHVGTFSV